MVSLRRKQAGIDFFIMNLGGVGHREQNSGLIWCPPIGGWRSLLPAQVAAVVAAAELLLPGWNSPVTEEWFRSPRRRVAVDQKRPVEVLRAFNRLLGRANAAYPALAGITNKATVGELRSYGRALAKAATILDCTTAKKLERDPGISMEIKVAREALRSAGLADLALRFLTMVESAEAQKEFPRPLQFLMPELVRCFEAVFEVKATSGWGERRGLPGRQEPSSPFIRFAAEFLAKIDAPLSNAHIAKEFYAWKRNIGSRSHK